MPVFVNLLLPTAHHPRPRPGTLRPRLSDCPGDLAPRPCPAPRQTLPLVSTAQPEWLRVISDREADIGSDLHWACAAAGKPRPAVRWLRNGEPLTSQVGDLGRPPPHPAQCALLPGPLPPTPPGALWASKSAGG